MLTGLSAGAASFSVVVVIGTAGAEGRVFLEVCCLGIEVGKKAAVVLVVTLSVVVILLLGLGGGLVGMKGKCSSVWVWGVVFLKLSSIKSVSTKSLKFCLLLSLWRLITVMSRSSKFCSSSTS